MVADIGETLFVNLLGMTQYPGDPFTGNIYRDIIMFLIVPTIFIIMVLYIMSGRIIPDKKFRVMLGVGAYLFIIAGGYYSFFALLAGPYFIFLIFILGVLGYLAGHFRRGGHTGGPYSGGGGYSRGHSKGGLYSNLVDENIVDQVVSRFRYTTNDEKLEIAQEVRELIIKTEGHADPKDLYQAVKAQHDLEKRLGKRR